MEVKVKMNLEKEETEKILKVHKDLETFVSKSCEFELERILKAETKSEVKEAVKDGATVKKDGS